MLVVLGIFVESTSADDLQIIRENQYRYTSGKTYSFKNSIVDESSRSAGIGFDYPKTIWKLGGEIVTIDGSDFVYFTESGVFIRKVPAKGLPKNGKLGKILLANSVFLLVSIDYFDDASDVCSFDLAGKVVSYLKGHYINNVVESTLASPAIEVVFDDGYYTIDARTGKIAKSKGFSQRADRNDRSSWIKLSPEASLNITTSGINILKPITTPEGWKSFDFNDPLASLSIQELTHDDPVYEKYLGGFILIAHFFDREEGLLYVSIAIPHMPGTNDTARYSIIKVRVLG